uniref:Uncharacterized protein n=1 Tax=Caenorhabditis japonica TaxID=281687 RepID=A0A8R1EUW2_CAEJA
MRFKVDLLKDELEEKDASLNLSSRECRDLTSEVKALRRTIEALQATHQQLKHEIAQRDELIQENGLCLVEEEDPEDDGSESTNTASGEM